MDNKDLYNSARRYVTTNAVVGSAASKLAELNREEAAKLAEIKRFYSHYLSDKELAAKIGHYILIGNLTAAFEFLNDSLRGEIVHDCQNQTNFKIHLSQLIDERREKYRPFYEKIGHEIPASLNRITAEEVCALLGEGLMTYEQIKKYHKEKESQEKMDKFLENAGLVLRAVLIIGLLIFMAYMSAQ